MTPRRLWALPDGKVQGHTSVQGHLWEPEEIDARTGKRKRRRKLKRKR